jgi:hypothetical protein
MNIQEKIKISLLLMALLIFTYLYGYEIIVTLLYYLLLLQNTIIHLFINFCLQFGKLFLFFT